MKKMSLYSLSVIVLLCLMSNLSASRSVVAANSFTGEVVPTPSAYAYLPIVMRPLMLPRPNIILIVSDDQRYDTMDYMPLTKDKIFNRGVTFDRAYVTTPLCCPSRSTILTGLYAHNHFVYDNDVDLLKPTFVERFHDAGYLTGIVGKYLNSWEGAMRPEFDYWVTFAGHGAAQQYWDPVLNVNSDWTQFYGYMPYILRDYALDFLETAAQQNKPFLLIFTPNAPHEPADPAPGDETLYEGLAPYRPPNFMEDDISDKPYWLQNQPAADPDYMDVLRRKQLQSLHTLDTSVNDIFDRLSAYGIETNTVIIYMSDNAVFWGEHRLQGKGYAYEEAIHVPFAIRYDALIATPQVDSRLIGNIDIAPTLYELARIQPPPDMDGLSLQPLLGQQDVPWRDFILIEGWIGDHPYLAVRTDQYLLVETQNDINELYDMAVDPYQLQNQYYNPDYAAVVSMLQDKLTPYRAAALQITRLRELRGILDINSFQE